VERPNELISNPQMPPEISDIFNSIQNEYYFLSRRELLKYVATDDSTRGHGIYALLGINNIEKLRKFISSAVKASRQNFTNCKTEIQSAESRIAEILGLNKFSQEKVLNSLNQIRVKFGGTKIGHEDLGNPQKDLIYENSRSGAGLKLLEDDIEKICKLESEKDTILTQEEKFTTLIQKIVDNPDIKEAFKKKKLIDLGITSLDNKDECPLCGQKWKLEDIKKLLTKKQAEATEAAELDKKIQTEAKALLDFFSSLDYSLQNIIKHSTELAPKLEEIFNQWKTSFKDYKSKTEDSLPVDCIKTPIWNCCGLSEERKKSLQQLLALAKKSSPKPSPLQNDWNILIQVSEIFRNLERLQKKESRVQMQAEKINALQIAFEDAKENILESLYVKIEKDFIDNYKILHPDEPYFKGLVSPTKAGISMMVNFHNRGEHPPNALHSEGHQDSMGLCLFFALINNIQDSKISFILLDDVIMSIDAHHRRDICKLLTQKLPNKQLFITTHDKIWARQLNTENIVEHENTKYFYNWSVDTGPHYKKDYIQDVVQQYLKENNAFGAAATFRRYTEEIFTEICASLKAELPFDGTLRFEREELRSAAVKKIKEYLEKALELADKHNTDKAKTEQILQKIKNANKTLGKENWLLNPTTHFNIDYANITKEDFTPVYNATMELIKSLKCVDCNTLFHVRTKQSPSCLECKCSSIKMRETEPTIKQLA
jgi:hypothetical protein